MNDKEEKITAQDVADSILKGMNQDDKKTTTTANTSSEQHGTSHQESQSTGTSTQSVSWKGVDPKTIENNELLRRIREGQPFQTAAREVYAKPDPEDLEKIERRRRNKENAATLVESLKMLSDIGTAFGGGNVYERSADKDMANVQNEYKEERNRYQKKLDDYNKTILDAIMKDKGIELSTMKDMVDKLAYETTSTNDQKRTADASSDNNSSGKQNHTEKTNYGAAVNRTSSPSDSKQHNRTVSVSVGDRMSSIEIKGGESGYKDWLKDCARVINEDDVLCKSAASSLAKAGLDISADDIKRIMTKPEEGETALQEQIIRMLANASVKLTDVTERHIEPNAANDNSLTMLKNFPKTLTDTSSVAQQSNNGATEEEDSGANWN